MKTPANTEAEMSVLGSMLLDWEGCAEAFTALKPDDFYLPANRLIFEEIGFLTAANTPTDFVILREALVSQGMLEKVGGMEYLSKVVESVPTSANAKYYASIVLDHSIRRKLVVLSRKMASQAIESDEGGFSLVAKFQHELAGIETGRTEGFTEISRDMLAAKERLKEIEVRREAGLPLCNITTGLKRLDKFIALEPGILCIIAGHPGMGKTTFLLNMLLANAKNGRKAAVFSLEMSTARIALNALISFAEISGKDARRGELSYSDKQRLIEKHDRVAKLPGVWYTPPAMSVQDLWAWSRKAVRQHGAELIMVDYLQMVQGKGRDTRERIGSVSSTLKAITKDLAVPVVVLSQLRRFDRQDNRPMLSDLKESSNLEQDADIVLGLYREAYWNRRQAEIDGTDHDIEISILKDRDGETGTFDDPPFYYDFDRFLMGEKAGVSE